MSDEIQKKLNFSSSTVWWREVIIKISKDEQSANFTVMMQISILGRNSWVFKVLAQEMSDKKIQFIMHNEWWYKFKYLRINIEQIFGDDGNFQFLVEILEF